ncbi:nucleotidyl transferase AbiEii/AbiGii toxin family protein [Patescibacteria group bacterium]|nr:nucleotidyl transferase AbiEii/AbiGii toxin family protein [Patescibacteria group bacterium]
MENLTVLKAQKKILKLVADRYPQVYMVGGTAISLLYNHRISEDLDFFTHKYTGKLHREIAAYIKHKTGFPFIMIEEEKRSKYVPMAVYEFEIRKKVVLKVDFVKDVADLIRPRNKNGMANIEDIYYRKVLAGIGWKAGESNVGRKLAGGRHKTKDLFDIFYLSTRVQCLSQWFPVYFGHDAYERLAAWYLSVPRQRAIMELLDMVPDCDTKIVFEHLDDEIIHKLNRRYLDI